MEKKQYFDKPITDVIKSRHSVRTYRPENLSKELKEKLDSYAKDIKGPFETNVRLELIDDIDITESAGGKIGTYGVIKGARAYIAGIIEKGKYSEEQLGYALEKLILFAASLGLGSCWLGGTFKRSEFAELLKPTDNELIPIVTPVGYPEKRRSVLESLMRAGAGSDKRKPWNELFFEGSFQKPLNETAAGKYAEALEMLRLAPSASNKQPWRVVREGSTFHFYLQPTKGYGISRDYSIQKIDIGIAMCHFEMAAVEAGLIGKWEISKPNEIAVTDQTEYIVSWVEK